MKKILCVLLVCIVAVFVSGCSILENDNSNVLRIHIRANSNEAIDQLIKYEVKDKLLGLFSRVMDRVECIDDAYKLIKESVFVLEDYANYLLEKFKSGYKASVYIAREYFEDKEIDGKLLSAGVYNAVIVRLGKGNGNNWWGLVYPSLSYISSGENVDYSNIEYESRIMEIYNSIII